MKIQIIITLLIAFSACSNVKRDGEELVTPTTPNLDTNWNFYGDTIETKNSVDASSVPKMINEKDSIELNVKGLIIEVCQKKGCWMIVKVNDSTNMRVRFKDYGFFVPKDAAGKKVCFEGFAFNDTTSVETLRHYASDAGKSKAEIDAILYPEINLSFEAHGVAINK